MKLFKNTKNAPDQQIRTNHETEQKKSSFFITFVLQI